MNKDKDYRIGIELTQASADELYELLSHQYIDHEKYPRVHKLLDSIKKHNDFQQKLERSSGNHT